jgi:hypothetical protein
VLEEGAAEGINIGVGIFYFAYLAQNVRDRFEALAS